MLGFAREQPVAAIEAPAHHEAIEAPPHHEALEAPAQDKEPVQAGTVYIAPPDYHLLLDRGPTLALSTDELVHYSRPSIDVLFESAADVYGKGLLGIILTGWNQDGADGLQAVHRAGGLTIVQNPDTAEAPVMPQAALARTAVDYILNLEEIAALLAALPAGKRT